MTNESEIIIPINTMDFDRISTFLKENPNIKHFQIIVNNGSGIGSTLEVQHITSINGRVTRIFTEISGVENW